MNIKPITLMLLMLLLGIGIRANCQSGRVDIINLYTEGVKKNFKLGSNVTIGSHVKNNGSRGSELYYRFYLSLDDKFEWNKDFLVGTNEHDNLSKGKDSRIETQIKIPKNITTGEYYLILYLVASDLETGDESSIKMNIVSEDVQPDYTISAWYDHEDEVKAGSRLEFGATI